MNPVFIRQAEKADLAALEWDGEYTHFRRLYADTYMMVEQGAAFIWIAEIQWKWIDRPVFRVPQKKPS